MVDVNFNKSIYIMTNFRKNRTRKPHPNVNEFVEISLYLKNLLSALSIRDKLSDKKVMKLMQIDILDMIDIQLGIYNWSIKDILLLEEVFKYKTGLLEIIPYNR